MKLFSLTLALSAFLVISGVSWEQRPFTEPSGVDQACAEPLGVEQALAPDTRWSSIVDQALRTYTEPQEGGQAWGQPSDWGPFIEPNGIAWGPLTEPNGVWEESSSA